MIRQMTCTCPFVDEVEESMTVFKCGKTFNEGPHGQVLINYFDLKMSHCIGCCASLSVGPVTQSLL